MTVPVSNVPGVLAVGGAPDAALDGTAMDHCSLCGALINLQPPTFDVPAMPWLCGGCGSVYLARSAEPNAGLRSGKARVVPYDQIIDVASINSDSPNHHMPRRALKQLVRFLSSTRVEAEDKRREPRYPAILPVIAIPMGRNFRIIGKAVQMTTINISQSGTALLDLDACTASYLALDFAVAGLKAKAVLEVLRVRPILSAHEVAGRLKCRIVDRP
jgi:hypothetical protein